MILSSRGRETGKEGSSVCLFWVWFAARSLWPIVGFQKNKIREQARVIQAQAEEITQLKTTVQELRDEIARLNKTPKHPKFRPGRPTTKGKHKASSDPSHDQSPVEASNQKIKCEKLGFCICLGICFLIMNVSYYSGLDYDKLVIQKKSFFYS